MTDTTMVDSTELWAVANTPGFARFHLVVDPVASMDGGGPCKSKPKGHQQVSRVIEHRAGMTRLMYV